MAAYASALPAPYTIDINDGYSTVVTGILEGLTSKIPVATVPKYKFDEGVGLGNIGDFLSHVS